MVCSQECRLQPSAEKWSQASTFLTRLIEVLSTFCMPKVGDMEQSDLDPALEGLVEKREFSTYNPNSK